MFKAITNGVSVTAMPVYIDERSNPSASQYFWAYRIIVENQSDQTVQLVSRYWKIVDSNGRVEEVSGDGVVGLQPFIKAGEDFSYTSGCPLTTPSGIMQGHYTMVDHKGGTFDVEIPAFPLDLPGLEPVIN
ncbi:MAG: Co2+/Mg2+ efflux protein ApaG [Pseudomonadota bacterium]